MYDVVVVGGGVAGLSAARILAERKARVVLLEQAPRLASAASGNNAAIFRPFEETAASVAFPRRSHELLAHWFGPSLFDPTGLILVSAERDSVDRLAAQAAEGGVEHARLDRLQLWELAPSLAAGEAHYALHRPGGGVLDVPSLTAGLADQARGFGAELRTNVGVRALARQSGRVTGVVLTDGTRLSAASVICAAGAWNAGLGEWFELPVPLAPLRRHLLQLRASARLPETEPVVWRIDDEIYYRRRGASVLASPCDERLAAATDQPVDPNAPALLRNKLTRLAPALAASTVERVWACLRTFARDRELVLGADPRVTGLFWFGGLGGRGMSVAPAAAEWLASRVLATHTSGFATSQPPTCAIDASKFG